VLRGFAVGDGFAPISIVFGLPALATRGQDKPHGEHKDYGTRTDHPSDILCYPPKRVGVVFSEGLPKASSEGHVHDLARVVLCHDG
jgi:hypothetical protein